MKISFLLTEAPQVSVCRCAAQGISQCRAQLPKGQPEEHYPIPRGHPAPSQGCTWGSELMEDFGVFKKLLNFAKHVKSEINAT